MIRSILPAVIVLALAAPAPPARDVPVRGMTVSCQTWGWEWGSDDMVEAMRELRDLGVNWISIHPYAGIRGDGTVRWRRRGDGDFAHLTRPIREAHRLGLKIMIKPHLAYWGSPFSWRGDIAFETDEQWASFFDGYEAWIARLAEVCAEADAFVVGTELDRTVHHETRWRRLIGRVRERFGGPLTYAANWTDYQRVPFWDALDVVGIQAYFPLATEPGLPDPDDLDRAWARHLEEVGAFSERLGKRVVMCELGYSCSDNAAVRPWEGREGGTHAGETQRRCLTAALRAIEGDDTVVGVFLWKWFAGPARRENFLMSTPQMRAVIKAQWAP